MNGYFKDKVIWITGASSGIGEALAVGIAGPDINLVLSARREQELQRVAKICEAQGAKVLVLPMDLAEITLFPAKKEQVLQHFPQIDILIHNAGITCHGQVINTPFAIEEELFKINFLAAVALTKVVLPAMLDKGKGQIIAIASALAYIEYPERAPYVASKHAMLGYFHTLGIELAAQDIKVGVICPGYVQTELGKNVANEEEFVSNRHKRRQTHRMSAEDCAKKIIDAIVKAKKEVYIGAYEACFIRLRRYFPSLYFTLISFVWKHWQVKQKDLNTKEK